MKFILFFYSIIVTYKKIGERAFIMQKNKNLDTGARADSDEESECDDLDDLHMGEIVYKYEESICSSSSDGSESDRLSPIPDDANSKILF